MEIVNFLLRNLEFSANDYSSALWHSANNGHANIVKELLHLNIDKEIFQKPALDGTTPLIMAIVKGHMEVIKCFEEKMGSSRLAVEMAKFGKVYDSAFEREHQFEAMENSILSGKLETIEHIKKMSSIEVPTSLIENVYDKEVLKLFECDSEQKSSKLVEFSREFPLFNNSTDDVELDISNFENSKICVEWPKLCFMNNLKHSDRTVLIRNIDITDSCSK